jgi:hypothetical protein
MTLTTLHVGTRDGHLCLLGFLLKVIYYSNFYDISKNPDACVKDSESDIRNFKVTDKALASSQIRLMASLKHILKQGACTLENLMVSQLFPTAAATASSRFENQ